MKIIRVAISTFLTAVSHCVLGQGTFQYDQQAYGNESPPPFGTGSAIQQAPTPFGQSFTPSLSSVGFIRMIFDDHNPSNGLGATLYVNLRADSITGTLLSTTTPVAMPDNFSGTADFRFPSAVPVTPGTLYFFEPLVQSGDLWNTPVAVDVTYIRGAAIVGGQSQPFSIWFREGIIVPEPSSALMLSLGGALFVLARWRRAQKQGHA